MLAGKKIIIAVCGSIAAYKTAFFIRLLVKEGAEIKVIMTSSAKDFITPLTLSTLSKNPVYLEFLKNNQGEWVNHVKLGLWADLMIVAPLSANTLAKLANGLSDNLLTAVYLSARCPVMVSPAMDLDMYQHPTTRENLRKLAGFGNRIIEAEEGELASGLHGIGRMAEPEHLLDAVKDHFKKKESLKGKKVLITSGPTHEAFDPVRFIGNHSTGKMGRSIALACANRGATVEFITGPVQHLPNHPGIQIQKITSAEDLFKASKKSFKNADIAIFTAAVVDYRPKEVSPSKIKKDKGNLEITLVPNPDIAMELGKLKSKKQITVGFALETDNEAENAQAKLKKKNLDMIVLNSLNHEGAGFSHDTNKVTIFQKDNKQINFELKTKDQVAEDLLDELEKLKK
ncbi:MAG: bifunctional phosphopantothenoylcysteine decarboxylase/phosphopantothenate--cysteine ligase CoaBC [Bacteroidota bacterium]